MYVHVYVYINIIQYLCIVCLCIFIVRVFLLRVCVCVCLCMPCVCMFMYVNVCVYMYSSMCIFVCVCICIYTNIMYRSIMINSNYFSNADRVPVATLTSCKRLLMDSGCTSIFRRRSSSIRCFSASISCSNFRRP